jgi:hypothetical protein
MAKKGTFPFLVKILACTAEEERAFFIRAQVKLTAEDL